MKMIGGRRLNWHAKCGLDRPFKESGKIQLFMDEGELQRKARLYKYHAFGKVVNLTYEWKEMLKLRLGRVGLGGEEAEEEKRK